MLVWRLTLYQKRGGNALFAATSRRIKVFEQKTGSGFDTTNTDLGANGIAKYLENHGIHKIPRQNGTNELFAAGVIRRMLANPVYVGKIAYGRRRTQKVKGTRDDYRQAAGV